MNRFHALLASTVCILISIFLVRETSKTQSVAIPSDDFDYTSTSAIFNNLPVPLPAQVAYEPPASQVLGEATHQKKIYVDLTNQRLYAYEGDDMIFSFLVSTGKWGRTPTGVFRIWGKNRYAKMSGGSAALHTYYYLPNVPYVMWFSNEDIAASRGFSIHGTYWHDNFGHPMSHGCVNMKTSEAALIYEWTHPKTGPNKSSKSTTEDPGTLIVIYGETPRG